MFLEYSFMALKASTTATPQKNFIQNQQKTFDRKHSAFKQEELGDTCNQNSTVTGKYGLLG